MLSPSWGYYEHIACDNSNVIIQKNNVIAFGLVQNYFFTLEFF